MITLMLIVVLFFGIRVSCGLNYSMSTISFNIILFGRWYPLRLTIKVINGKFYYYINNSIPKLLNIDIKKRYSRFRMPKIKLHDVFLHLYISSEDIVKVNMVGGIFVLICDYLRHNAHIVAEPLEEHLSIVNDYFDVKLAVEFTIKYSLLKIIFAYLHMILLDAYYRRRYGTQSNRRTNAVHTR